MLGSRWRLAGLAALLLASLCGADTIAYVSEGDIWRIDTETLESRRLTNQPGFDGDPAWSSAGDRLAFVSTRGDVASGIFTMGPDGTDVVDTGLRGRQPSFSPDGLWLSYTTGTTLAIAHVNGSGARPLLVGAEFSDGYLSYPSWDPSGERLAFVSAPAFIYLVDTADAPCSPFPFIDGPAACPSLRRLLFGRVDDGQPAWSPDGRRIAFQDHTRISTVRPDGTGLQQLTGPDLFASSPTWSPDSQRIAFVGGSPVTDLYVMDHTGGNRRQLTQGVQARHPAWQRRAADSTAVPPSWGSIKRAVR